MIKDLTAHQMALAEFMSNISERCYSAGWMNDLEYVLWNAMQHGERKYGHDRITQMDIETLKDLSKAANAWIVWDDETEESAIDLDSWGQKYNQDLEQNPAIIRG